MEKQEQGGSLAGIKKGAEQGSATWKSKEQGGSLAGIKVCGELARRIYI
jgi:phage tail tape-measure protein